MNAIAVAFVAAVLAGGVAYAHSSRSAESLQPAGTLSCTTRTDLSLVFGNTPVADCTFVSGDEGFRQDYVALFAPLRRLRDTSAAETMRWEVMTRDGVSQPGMISGSFEARADQPELSTPAGASASERVPVSLKLVSHSGQRIVNFALGTPRIAFAMATENPVR
ncbi:MAG: DUF992 domain-containing protein [Methylobacterium frigidaeris]